MGNESYPKSKAAKEANMTHIHAYKFNKVMKDLLACADDLQLQLAATRAQCEQITEVMIAIRQDHKRARNHVLPISQIRSQAAND